MAEWKNKNIFGLLLGQIKGNDRSASEFARQSGVSLSYISRLMKGKIKSPPNPAIIKSLTENGGLEIVPYDIMMIAAGYTEPIDSIINQYGFIASVLYKRLNESGFDSPIYTLSQTIGEMSMDEWREYLKKSCLNYSSLEIQEKITLILYMEYLAKEHPDSKKMLSRLEKAIKQISDPNFQNIDFNALSSFAPEWARTAYKAADKLSQEDLAKLNDFVLFFIEKCSR
ncbi:MAG: hypothetical protein ABFD08_14110 [Syntrophomonas sp.]